MALTIWILIRFAPSTTFSREAFPASPNSGPDSSVIKGSAPLFAYQQHYLTRSHQLFETSFQAPSTKNYICGVTTRASYSITSAFSNSRVLHLVISRVQVLGLFRLFFNPSWLSATNAVNCHLFDTWRARIPRFYCGRTTQIGQNQKNFTPEIASSWLRKYVSESASSPWNVLELHTYTPRIIFFDPSMGQTLRIEQVNQTTAELAENENTALNGG